MSGYRCIVLALTAFFPIGLLPARGDQLPKEAQAILEKAGQFELLSIEPSQDQAAKDAFHGWKVLGKTTVKDGETRKKVMAAFLKGVADGSVADAARCFTPRHGIHAVHDGKTADFVICFECGQVKVLVGDEKTKGAYTTQSAQPTLDAVLEDAKVPLAAKAKAN